MRLKTWRCLCITFLFHMKVKLINNKLLPRCVAQPRRKHATKKWHVQITQHHQDNKLINHTLQRTKQKKTHPKMNALATQLNLRLRAVKVLTNKQ